MSSAGRAASSSGCVGRPRGHETGLTGYAGKIQHSSPTGSSAMETAEHREPYESRGSRTDLGAPRGATPLGDSTYWMVPAAPAERALSVQLKDLRRDARQRTRCADWRPSRYHDRTAGAHPERPFTTAPADGRVVKEAPDRSASSWVSAPRGLADAWPVIPPRPNLPLPEPPPGRATRPNSRAP